MINWRPIDAARKQTAVLVGHEAYPGWFEVAEYQITVGWVHRGTSRQLEHEPTHFAEIEPPPFPQFKCSPYCLEIAR